jgi:hypothetical protein
MTGDDLLEPDDEEPGEDDVVHPDEDDEREDAVTPDEHIGLTPPD